MTLEEARKNQRLMYAMALCAIVLTIVIGVLQVRASDLNRMIDRQSCVATAQAAWDDALARAATAPDVGRAEAAAALTSARETLRAATSQCLTE